MTQPNLTKQETMQIIARTSFVTIILNALLGVIKLLAGIFGNSRALVADAVHSLSDMISTVIVVIGAKIARKDPDDNHPYGHEKFESVAAAMLGMLLLFTGLLVGYQGLMSLLSQIRGEPITVPSTVALVAAAISIVVKEGMYWFTRHQAKRASSTAMLADAWHQRSDALSSVGGLIGVGLAMAGFLMFDALAAMVIALLVLRVAYTILRDAMNQVVDKAPEPEVITAIETAIHEAHEGVLSIDELRIRMHGDKLFVDVEIGVNALLTMIAAHAIAETVHHQIESQFPRVLHCMVHVNPHKKPVSS